MWIVIDGPEKAGKTTTAQFIADSLEGRGLTVKYRHWSGTDPVSADAYDELMDDLDEYRVIIWDRSWASGQVYTDLGLEQKPEAVKQGGEAVFSVFNPVKLMFIGPSAEALAEKRTPDDVPVSASLERAAFIQYAVDHEGWAMWKSDYTNAWLKGVIDWVDRQLENESNG